MIEYLTNQVIQILNNSENGNLRTSQIIGQLNDFDPASNDHKVALATALDILSDNGQIWIENPPSYVKSLDGLVSFNDKVISIDKNIQG